MARRRRKRSGPTKAAIHLAQYVAARSFAWLFGAFPPEQNLRTADAVADIWMRFNAARLARASGNIRRGLPHLSDAEVDSLARASVHYMFRTYMVDAFQLPRLLTEETWPRHVDLDEARPLGVGRWRRRPRRARRGTGGVDDAGVLEDARFHGQAWPPFVRAKRLFNL